MRTFAPSHRPSATRAARRCPPGLPLHEVLAVVVLIPHASRLRYFALDASIDETALVDPVEHRAHRRRGHPVEVPEDDLATLGQIGRASCRERDELSVVAVTLRKIRRVI